MDLDQHIRALGIAHILYSALLLIPAVIVYVVLCMVGMFSGDEQAEQILPLIGTSVAIFLIVLSIPGFVAGYGVLKRKKWGLPVALVIGLLNILCFPFGTALGGYSFWVFTKSNEQLRSGGKTGSESNTYSS